MESDGSHRYIGRAFLQELTRDLLSGEHIALLGPRGSGKALVVEELANRAQAIGRTIIQLPTGNRRRFDLPGVVKEIATQVGLPAPMVDEEDGAALPIEDLLRSAVRQAKHGVSFFASNLVQHPTSLVRGLLGALQACATDPVTERSLSVVITGNGDFVHLTYAPNSPYRYAKKYVIRGLDREAIPLFVKSVRLGRKLLGGFDDPPPPPEHSLDAAAVDLLFEETGGYLHLITDILTTRVRHAAFCDGEPIGAWSFDDIKRLIREYQARSLWRDDRLRLSLRSVERSAVDFDLLHEVVRRGSATRPLDDPLDWRSGIAPEVSGLVRLDEDVVRVACPIIGRYLEEIFKDDRYVADVLALQGRWDRAWGYYEKVPTDRRERPASGDGEAHFRAVVRAWEDEFIAHSANEEAPKARVFEHFERGACLLLGFNEVVMSNGVAGQGVPEGLVSSLRKDADSGWGAGITRVERGSEPWSRAWSVPRSNLMSSDTPVISLIRRGRYREIDADQARDLTRSCDYFWQAFLAADRIEHDRRIGQLRERHLTVINEVNRCLLDDEISTQKLLVHAAKALIDTGYYQRVQFCLVDGLQQHIQAVVSEASSGVKKIDFPTNLSLVDSDEEKTWDIQRWVWFHKKPKAIRDAANPSKDEPKTQAQKCLALGMTGFAVVPLLVQSGVDQEHEVLGTLHVERLNGLKPGESEIELLVVLAAQIASALHLCRRLTFLRRSLDNLPGRVRIVDPLQRVLFANLPEANAREITNGWRSPAVEAESACPCEACKDVVSGETHCLIARLSRVGVDDKKDRLKNEVIRRYGVENERPFDWTIAAIDDDRGPIVPDVIPDSRIGYIEHRFDLGDLFDLNKTLSDWLDTESVEATASRIVAYYLSLGHKWCRLYLLKEDGHSRFFTYLAQGGLTKPENIERFVRGRVTPTGHTNDGWPWPYFEGMPTRSLFQQTSDPELPVFGRKGPTLTEKGFRSYEVREPDDLRQRLEKESTNRWIVAPLRFGRTTLGLMSLAFPEEITPRRWGLLRWSILSAGIALKNALRAEELRRLEREKMVSAIVHRAQHQLLNALDTPGSVLKWMKEERDDLPSKWRSVIDGAYLWMASAQRISRDFGRYATYREFPDVTPVRLPGLLQRLHEDLRLRYPTGVKFSPARDVPDVAIEVSEDAMQEVFHILAENSILHSDVSGDHLKVVLRAFLVSDRSSVQPESKGRYARIEFSDNGRGVLAELKPRIFEPLFTEHKHGSGLGLPIAADFVRRNNGSIHEDGVARVEGRPNSGARFAIYLPVFQPVSEQTHERR